MLQMHASWKYIIYELWIGDRLMYVGYEKINRPLTAIHNLNENIIWVQYLISSNYYYYFNIVKGAATEIEAIKLHMNYKFEMKPLITSLRRSDGKRVQCIETGVVYENVARAAEAFAVTPAAIYSHLKGRDKFDTVRRHTFRRI